MICAVNKVKKILGGNVIFEEVSFEIKDRQRLGIVGRNGSGKTTILKMLAGVEQADEGEIFIKKGAGIGYLEQIPLYEEGVTVRDVLMEAFLELQKIEEEMKKLESLMAEHGTTHDQMTKWLDVYGKLQEKFASSGGYEMESELMKVAAGLNILSLLDHDFCKLSGGEKTKVCLGRLLLSKPDLLLLDEPTNHLDIQAVEWLETFLREYRGAVVVVSHDRYFLDLVVTHIIDVEDGELTVYHGNYSYFTEEKEKRLLAEFEAYKEQQNKIKKMKQAIKRLKEWANRANPPNEGLHRRARNMERALERMEKLKRPNIDPQKIQLSFELRERSGTDVIMLEGVSKAYDHRVLFEDVTFHVRFRERVSIVGENGSGKSTLFRMITGEINPDRGTVKVGSNLRIGYVTQHLMDERDRQRTVLEVFRDQVPVTEGEARSILARFLFYGFSVFKKVDQLSGGERMRLRLAQLMHQDINLLLLDEPTNHLDIESREVLEEALEQFSGTIVCISHDRYFLNRCFPVTYWLENRSLTRYEGNYDEVKNKRISNGKEN